MYTTASAATWQDQIVHDFDVNPPQYPGQTMAHPQHSNFRLPTYEEVIKLSKLEDSIRLPAYQARHLNRYHPYLCLRRLAPSFQCNMERYMNTVYDDEYTPLEVPPVMRPATLIPFIPSMILGAHNRVGITAGTTAARELIATSAHEDINHLEMEEAHRQRVYRLRHVMPYFLQRVQLAIIRSAEEQREQEE